MIRCLSNNWVRIARCRQGVNSPIFPSLCNPPVQRLNSACVCALVCMRVCRHGFLPGALQLGDVNISFSNECDHPLDIQKTKLRVFFFFFLLGHLFQASSRHLGYIQQTLGNRRRLQSACLAAAPPGLVELRRGMELHGLSTGFTLNEKISYK